MVKDLGEKFILRTVDTVLRKSNAKIIATCAVTRNTFTAVFDRLTLHPHCKNYERLRVEQLFPKFKSRESAFALKL